MVGKGKTESKEDKRNTLREGGEGRGVRRGGMEEKVRILIRTFRLRLIISVQSIGILRLVLELVFPLILDLWYDVWRPFLFRVGFVFIGLEHSDT